MKNKIIKWARREYLWAMSLFYFSWMGISWGVYTITGFDYALLLFLGFIPMLILGLSLTSIEIEQEKQ